MKNLNSIQKLVLLIVGVILIYNVAYILPDYYDKYSTESEQIAHQNSLLLFFWSKISIILITGIIFIFVLNNRTINNIYNSKIIKSITTKIKKQISYISKPIINKNKQLLFIIIPILSISLIIFLYSIYLNKKYNYYTNTINTCNNNLSKYAI